jgi:glycosyltransferase involved in cell wall biosynthesis
MTPDRRRPPLSCFVITRNEAGVLDQALRSVAELVDEIVVVDSGSTDGTLAIAREFGARIIERDWPGFGPQKRFAEQACRHEWVLNLDADEALSPGLAAEIGTLFELGAPRFGFYALPRALVYPGRRAPALARRDAPIRLYDRRLGGFSEADVHEGVARPRVPIGRLRHPLLHYAARSIAHLTEKNLAYARLSASDPSRAKPPIAALYVRLLFEFPAVFVRTYLFRGHALNGAQGFALAVSVAFASFMKVVMQIEERGTWIDAGPGFKRLPEERQDAGLGRVVEEGRSW